MSAFLKLNKQDAFITPYTAHKSYSYSTAQGLEDAGIDRLLGVSGSSDDTGIISTYSEGRVYDSVNHLYYASFTSANVYSGSYEHYLQSSLDPERVIADELAVISIPKSLFGESIKPSSLVLTLNGDEITDNGEGVLYCNDEVVGNILYGHGMLVITDEQPFAVTAIADIPSTTSLSLEFQNSHTIFEHTYQCRSNQSQLNFSQNPSTFTNTDESGSLLNNVTGSYFQPYVTSVGLYNDANELVAVGKLGQPIPKSQYSDMTFVVKFDA